MPESVEDIYTITGVIATTGELSGRSFRLGLTLLEKIRDSILDGDLEMGLDHDSQKAPIAGRLISVSLAQEETGEHALRGEWEIAAADADRIGSRRSVSVTTIDWEIDGWEGVEDPDLAIVPDCYHWSDLEIAEVLRAASSGEVTVSGGRLIQLSDAPPIKVLIEVLNNPQVAAALWAAIATAVTALVTKLKKRREATEVGEQTSEKAEHAPQMTFEVNHNSYKAIVNCSTDDSAERISAQVVEAVKSLGLPPETAPTPRPIDTNDFSNEWTKPE